MRPSLSTGLSVPSRKTAENGSQDWNSGTLGRIGSVPSESQASGGWTNLQSQVPAGSRFYPDGAKWTYSYGKDTKSSFPPSAPQVSAEIMSRRPGSIVVSKLCNMEGVLINFVNDPVFIGNATGPVS